MRNEEGFYMRKLSRYHHGCYSHAGPSSRKISRFYRYVGHHLQIFDIENNYREGNKGQGCKKPVSFPFKFTQGCIASSRDGKAMEGNLLLSVYTQKFDTFIF